MPNQNLTEIAVIMDRSGSMQRIHSDMVGGFAKFLEDQKQIPDPCVVSLYQFDNEFSVVYEERNLREIQGLDLQPRGNTALYDACGRAIVMIGERLAKKPDELRPGKVVVMIITDGMENASREYRRDAVKEMIEHQQNVYNWQFLFLGSNIDAPSEAALLGIPSQASRNFTSTSEGVKNVYEISSDALRSYRASKDENEKLSFDSSKSAQDGKKH